MHQVLVVEDSPIVQKILRHLTAGAHDFRPVFAETRAEAELMIDNLENHFFCALVDLHLPDAPDGEVVEIMLDQGIPTIVLTGKFDEELQTDLVAKGIVDYVLKEGRFSYEHAIEMVHRLIANESTEVLVADDSLTARSHLRKLLELQLFKVWEAEDGGQAIDTLKQNSNIKMLITDYNMPNMDGFELVREVRKHPEWSNLVILGISSSEESALSAKFIKNGADDFLTKPFCPEEFFCRVMRNMDTQRLYEQVRKMAYEDYLTRIPNRRALFEKGGVLYERAKSKKSLLAVAMLDIDYFKRVNDEYGHEAGDTVLQFFATELQETFYRFLVARTGGEEFCVLFPGLKNDQAYTLVDAFRSQIASQSVQITEQLSLDVTFSSGVSSVMGHNLEEQMHNADLLLYRAKEAGRNIVVGD